MTLKCLASGYPVPQYSWRRNGLADLSGVELSDNDTTLEIRNVTRKDGGVFQCTATNSLGSASSRAHVTVQGICLCVMYRCNFAVDRCPCRYLRNINIKLISLLSLK